MFISVGQSKLNKKVIGIWTKNFIHHHIWSTCMAMMLNGGLTFVLGELNPTGWNITTPALPIKQDFNGNYIINILI